jgi:glycosyltransferase involved in cell wall biosynthesis
MKILFDCRAIPANRSCGIENYTYSIVKSIARYYPELMIYCSVAVWDAEEYSRLLNVVEYKNIKIVFDHVQQRLYRLRKRNIVFRAVLYLLRKYSRALERVYIGERKKWIQQMEKQVDLIVYPYHRVRILQKDKPVLLISHDFYDFDHEQELDKKNRQLVTENIERANFIVVSWPEPFEQLKRRFPQKKSTAAMIPFLMDRPDYSRYQSVHKKQRQLVYASSTAEHKNHINLIRALGLLKKTNTEPIRVICTGRTYENYAHLLHAINEEGIEGWIEFRGYVARSEVIKLYAESVGVIAPTKYEAFSGTVMEGLQAGLPIACSRIPQLTIFIDQYLKIQVRYFNPDSPSDIADAILEILDRYEYYASESKKSHEFLNTLTEQYVAERYYQVFQTMLELNDNDNLGK